MHLRCVNTGQSFMQQQTYQTTGCTNYIGPYRTLICAHRCIHQRLHYINNHVFFRHPVLIVLIRFFDRWIFPILETHKNYSDTSSFVTVIISVRILLVISLSIWWMHAFAFQTSSNANFACNLECLLFQLHWTLSEHKQTLLIASKTSVTNDNNSNQKNS